MYTNACMTKYTNDYEQQKASKEVSKGYDFSGIYTPITTPFNDDESIAWDKLESNIKKMNATKLKGYVVQGSTGEFCYLSTEEKVETVRKVKEYSSKGKLIIGGSGCESTAQTIEMSCKMAEAGADAVMVLTPCYFKNRMDVEALVQHFKAVADASPVPVFLYNIPMSTGLDLPAEVAIQCAEHPNIVGMKESGGDITKIGMIMAATKNNHRNFCVIAGSTTFLLPASQVGSNGAVCGLGNMLPEACCRLQELIEQGELNEAMKLEHRLMNINMAVAKYNTGILFVKSAMDWFPGYYGGPTRKPLLPLDRKSLDGLKKAFVDNGFL